MKEIYFDNAATARPREEALAAVVKAMGPDFANASSLHRKGVDAAARIREAMEWMSALAGGGEWKVLFTSGGTEADNLAVLGSVPKGRRDTVVTSSLEHAAVESSCREVARRGGRCVVVKPRQGGVLHPQDVAAAVDDRTALVSIVHVAGEMGTVQPINDIARAVKQKNKKARFHTDAVQAAARLARLDYGPAVDMVALCGHKIGGPMGVGALLLRPGVTVRPLFFGGDQQEGERPGTFNVPGIAGMGAAARMMVAERAEAVPRLADLTARLGRRLLQSAEGVRLLGEESCRAPGLLVVAVRGVRSEVLLHTMEKYGLFASAGSACHSTRREPPACLVDDGLAPDEAVVRFTPGAGVTEDDVEDAARIFETALQEVRCGNAGRMK